MNQSRPLRCQTHIAAPVRKHYAVCHFIIYRQRLNRLHPISSEGMYPYSNSNISLWRPTQHLMAFLSGSVYLPLSELLRKANNAGSILTRQGVLGLCILPDSESASAPVVYLRSAACPADHVGSPSVR
ncbi:hypothetical protein TcWFU_007781 [Taenia crassiceps]|uniref:Uncharacterized protein n=1 Tax=Taenia crassiceps TaxID=6207 RepID=A0ABR4QI08_9CEST